MTTPNDKNSYLHRFLFSFAKSTKINVVLDLKMQQNSFQFTENSLASGKLFFPELLEQDSKHSNRLKIEF